MTTAQLAQMLSEIDATVIDGPKPGQTFKRSIINGIREIAQQYTDGGEDE